MHGCAIREISDRSTLEHVDNLVVVDFVTYPQGYCDSTKNQTHQHCKYDKVIFNPNDCIDKYDIADRNIQ